MKYSSKSEFVERTAAEWERLWGQFGLLESPQAAHQVLAHLYAWHGLLLGWRDQAAKGAQPALPAAGFRWRDTRALNASLDRGHAYIPLKSIVIRLKRSHGRVMKWVDELTERQLLEPGWEGWTGKLPLVSYIGPNTFSHYRWANKKLNRLG